MPLVANPLAERGLVTLASMTDDRLSRIKENDLRLNAVTLFNAKYAGSPEAIQQAWDTLRPLMQYYQRSWREDVDAGIETEDMMFGVLSEDGVWNEMGSFYSLMKDLQELTTRVVSEYEEG